MIKAMKKGNLRWKIFQLKSIVIINLEYLTKYLDNIYDNFRKDLDEEKEIIKNLFIH